MLIKVTGFYSDTREPYDAWVNPSLIDSIEVFSDMPGFFQINTVGLTRVAVKPDDLQKIIATTGEYPAEKYASTLSALMGLFQCVQELEKIVMSEHLALSDESFKKFQKQLIIANHIMTDWSGSKNPTDV